MIFIGSEIRFIQVILCKRVAYFKDTSIKAYFRIIFLVFQLGELKLH
ncbi:hypothetical protein BH11BAC2_BH11BAC2_22510 [soil metagenome]